MIRQLSPRTTGFLVGLLLAMSVGASMAQVSVSRGSSKPGGSDTQVQFNDGGAFGGDSGLTFNKTTDVLSGITSVWSTSLILGAAATGPTLTPTATTGLRISTGSSGGDAGSITIEPIAATTNGTHGNITIQGYQSAVSGNSRDGGSITLRGGVGGGLGQAGGTALLAAGAASGTNIAGANVTIRGGEATGNAAGGSIVFQTSAAGGSGTTVQTPTTRWTVDGSGHFLTGTDNAYDIGASGATRPRTGYFGTSVVSAGVVQTGAVAVASLPSCAAGSKGARHFVTDATATTFASTVTGGGANNVPVVCDGTNWIIG